MIHAAGQRLRNMYKFILNHLIKDPIGFIPLSFLVFQILHKFIVEQQKVYFLKEFLVSLQILWFSINISYVIKNSPAIFHPFYLYIIFVSQLSFTLISSIISRELYKEKTTAWKKYALLISFVVIPFLGLGILIYSMGFRFRG